MNIKKIFLSNHFIFLFLIAIIITFIFIGFNIWFLILISLYTIFYLIFISKTIGLSILKESYKWIILSLIILINFSFVIFLKPSSSSNTKVLSKEECIKIYEKYNKKIIDIKGDGITGKIGIQIEPDNCKSSVYYNILVTAELPQNYTMENSSYAEYKYVGSIRNPNDSRKYLRGSGQLFPAFVDKNILPDNPFDFGSLNKNYDPNNEYLSSTKTNVFQHSWRSDYTFKKDSLEELTSKTLYEITDGAKYMQKEDLGDNAYSYSLDTSKAAEEGNIIKSIQLTYIEK